MSSDYNQSKKVVSPRAYDELLVSVISRVENFQPTNKTVSVAELIRDALGPVTNMLDRGGTEDDVARILTEEGVPAKAETVRTAYRRANKKPRTEASRSDANTEPSSGDLPGAHPTQVAPIRPQDGASIGRHLD